MRNGNCDICKAHNVPVIPLCIDLGLGDIEEMWVMDECHACSGKREEPAPIVDNGQPAEQPF